MKKNLTAAVFGMIALSIGAVSLARPVSAAWKDIKGLPDVRSWESGNAVIEDAVSAVCIDWSAGDIDVICGEGSSLLIEESSEKEIPEEERLCWYLSGSTLYIKYSSVKSFFHFGKSLNKHLTVTLPEDGRLEKLEIDSSAGDVNTAVSAEYLEMDCSAGDAVIRTEDPVKTMDLDFSAGDISLEAGEIEKLEIDSSAGGVEFSAAGIGSMDIDVSAGSVKGELTSFDSGEIDISAGSLELKLPSDANFTMKADISAGSLNSDIPFQKQGKTYIFGEGKAKLDIDISAGNVNILEKQSIGQ